MDRPTAISAAQPTPEEVAARQLSRLLQLWEYESAFRAEMEKLWLIAGGDQSWMIRHMPHETDVHYERKPKFTPNLLGLALDELSTLYAEAPLREMDSAQGQSWAEESLWTWGTGLDSVMGRIDPLVRLQGAILARCRYQPYEGSAVDVRRLMLGESVEVPSNAVPGVEVRAVPRHRFCVLPNELDNRIPIAVLVRVSEYYKASDIGTVQCVRSYQYWDADMMAVLESVDGSTPAVKALDGVTYHPNVFGRIPYVLLQNSNLTDGVDPEGFDRWGGADLCDNVRTTAEMLSELAWVTLLQRGQSWVAGTDPKNLVIAPDAIWELGQGGTAGMLSGGASLDAMLEVINRFLGFLAITWGLSPRSLRVEVGQTPSGVALAIEDGARERDRKKREPVARGWERRIHECAAAVYSAIRGPMSTRLESITYRSPPPALTTEQIQSRLEFELTRGLISKRDAIRELHPELTEEQVDERAQRVTDEPGGGAPLNGAQVEALKDLLLSVSAGLLPPATAAELIKGAYPSFDPDVVDTMTAAAAANVLAEPPADESQPLPGGGPDM
jgi:hypothetical protein